MTPKIIGLLGRSRVGKDTVAEYISKNYPEYQIIRLSTPLKEAACKLYDFTPEQVETNQKEEIDIRWKKTPRECIQSLTEHMMQQMGKDFFTKRLYHSYDSNPTPKYIVIPDIRYEHDIYEIQKRGGIVIKIERPDVPVKHGFENQIDFLKGNHRIMNNSTIESLQKEVDILMKHLIKP